ncbi:11022_t:CDS:2, partial [Funneliformis mosseae]
QGKSASAPSAELLENDRIILQQLLRPYRSEDILNVNETELADYNIYDALLNAAEAWSMVSPETIANCWRKTNILSQEASFPIPDHENEMQELEGLINH